MATVNILQLSKKTVAYVVVGIVMITVMAIIGMSAFMQIRNIVVVGVPENTYEEIIEASGVSTGDNLLFVSGQNVSQNIRAELPFVNAAQVTRILPDTLKIEIFVSEAIATVQYARVVYVIDSTGRVLDRAEPNTPMPSGIDISGLIEIIGVEVEDTSAGNTLRPVFGTEPKFQHMQDILEILESEGLYRYVSYIDVSNVINVHFGFMDIYRVLLGGGTNLRPANLRDTLTGLLEDVDERIISIFHNVPGDIDLTGGAGSMFFRSND